MRIPSFALLCLLAMLAWAKPVHAAQSYDNCTGFITSIPAVISTQGTWCLNQDLATAITSGNAITINTNNVTIDCNDFKLGGQGAGLGTAAYGIDAVNRLNATVRHCNIRGFLYGVDFSGHSGGGHVVEDNRFNGNTYIGLHVVGDGSVVRRNQVFDTGGSTLANAPRGIAVDDSTDVLDNTVSGLMATSGGSVFGIELDGAFTGSVSGNRVRGLLKDGAGADYGIYSFGSHRFVLRNNDLIGDASAGGIGLLCASIDGSAKDNVISGFATGIFTCYDGGNLVRP